MADPKSKARVDRLLRGDFRPDDLTALFLYARDHCDGRETVTDIGDFVAHHNERDRGIITRSTRDWFTISRFFLPRFDGSPFPLYDVRKLPPSTRDYFTIAVNRIDASTIRKQTGLRRSKAYKIMTDLAERLTKNADGTWAVPDNVTATEKDLITCVSSWMVGKPAFEATKLCDDFIETLKSNGLITRDEIRKHREDISTLVQLYAVAAMHNCVVQIGDGTTTQLKGKVDLNPKQIRVLAASMPAPNLNMTLSSSMFAVDLDPTIHCHPDLLVDGSWDFEIEVTPDKRLSPLR
jgi:hypothetical protein